MITLNSLLEEARRLNLPLDKKRAILREYIQVLILKAVYKQKLGNKIYFMGGTALRLFYNIPRFSEDLDFNADKLTSLEFDWLLQTLVDTLQNEGFKVNLKRKDIYDIYSARIGLEFVMKNFRLSDKRGEDIVIKVEINNPSWPMRHEPLVYSSFGVLFTALLMDKGSLFAEKSHAFIKRCRGRDIFDILFMMRYKFPIDTEMFKYKKIEKAPKEALLNKFNSLNEDDLLKLSKQLKPFLFKDEEIEFVEKAKFYGPQLLKNYE